MKDIIETEESREFHVTMNDEEKEEYDFIYWMLKRKYGL